jgi:hypothetical protein
MIDFLLAVAPFVVPALWLYIVVLCIKAADEDGF